MLSVRVANLKCQKKLSNLTCNDERGRRSKNTASDKKYLNAKKDARKDAKKDAINEACLSVSQSVRINVEAQKVQFLKIFPRQI